MWVADVAGTLRQVTLPPKPQAVEGLAGPDRPSDRS
jgi:hypothetical protein